MTSFVCSYCTDADFSAPSEQLLQTHVRLVHSLDPNFRIQCSEGNCLRTFTNYRTYQNHRNSHHATSNNEEISDISTLEAVEANIEPSEPQDIYLSSDLRSNDCVVPDSKQLQLFAAKWLLKTSETRSLTRAASIGIVTDVSEMIHTISETLQRETSEVLTANSINPAVISTVSEIFHGKLTRPFEGLFTFHQQLKFYREQFNFVEPTRIVLKETTTQRLAGRRRRMVVKKTEIMYVPLLETLQNLLNNASVLQEVKDGHQDSKPGFISDYCDASNFGSHRLFLAYPSSLQLILYYDELEVCNPLGSRRKKHKIGAFYYLLGNLRPRQRSKISNIQLLLLAKYVHVAEFGIDRIMEPIIEDIKKLEHKDGVPFIINGKICHFRGTVTVVSADNPASASLGGFKESSSAFRFCRHCTGTKADIQSKFIESNFTLREKSQHMHHCLLIEGSDIPVPDRQHYSITFGVNRLALLNSLDYFDVTSGALLPDVMHDVLEGALPLEMKLMLKVFVIDQKLFTLDEIDTLFKQLNLRQFDGDKPSSISGISLQTTDGNLHQHAMQMWTLGRFLPLVIGHLIPESNEYWENFLNLLEIMDILFSRHIKTEQCGYLESLISDHHTAFRELYPDATITMKLHSMVHMPRLILEFGPLINYWTTCFEAKHKYFKHLSNVLGNFTNLCYSLALRHQLHQCYLSLNSFVLIGEDTEVGPGSVVQCPTSLIWNSSSSLSVESLFRANWVKVNGMKYQAPSALLVVKNEDPTFGKITEVFVIGEKVYFEFIPLVVQYFDHHFHAFVLIEPRCSTKFLIKYHDLIDYHPYGLYSLNTVITDCTMQYWYIVPRNHVY